MCSTVYSMDLAFSRKQASGGTFVYSREELLALQWTRQAGIQHPIPAELRSKYCGCRAGTKLKARLIAKWWRCKPSISSIVMGNVNSLADKSGEQLRRAAPVRNQRVYHECSLLCFTETWLTSNTPDTTVDIPGFTTVRADMDARSSGKRKGRGACTAYDSRWCNPGHVTVKETMSGHWTAGSESQTVLE